ncbi:hypothetical protein AGMMS50212_12790 [Spirochaetia bacterium]|nr:hypothetical protein AGMMS50212_12790 [Spirochaetia bacterium]
MKKKDTDKTNAFKLHNLGFFLLLLCAISLSLGVIRREVVLLLMGALFFLCLTYCFVMILILALVHKKRAFNLKSRILNDKVTEGNKGCLVLDEKKYFFSLPAVLIRYRLKLCTKDRKEIFFVFEKDFFKTRDAEFNVDRRGAYYGANDEILIADIFGFFSFALKVPQSEGERLLVLASPSGEVPFTYQLSGGAEHRGENKIIKTDELNAIRPYMPGDDPRRINWKLYSHAGELFVRDEENEPPPHSQLVLFIDTEVCPRLFPSDTAAQDAVDSLCRAALAVTLENTKRAIETILGWTGSKLHITNTTISTGFSEILARPYALPPDSFFNLPELNTRITDRHDILVLALPRFDNLKSDALTRFLSKKSPAQNVELFFCYNTPVLRDAAEKSALSLSNKIRSRAVQI